MKPRGGVFLTSTGSIATGTSAVVFGATGTNMALETAGVNALNDAVPLTLSPAPELSKASTKYVKRGFVVEIPISDARTGMSTIEPSVGASAAASKNKLPVERSTRNDPA